MAGSPNLLQFIGGLCLATGALYDEALGDKPRLVQVGSAVIIALAALNLVWHSRSSSYTPWLATDGYRSFLKEKENRLHETAKALAFNTPALNLYAQETDTSLAWDAEKLPWTTRAAATLPAGVKYVLIPGFVYEHMPPEQPVQRVVAEHWKLVWSHKRDHVWELRLYENPQAGAP